MALTVLQVNNFKPQNKDYKKSDARGLYLFVKSNGAKYWRLAYRFNKLQKTLAIGVYPEVSLFAAREQVTNVKMLIASQIDPSEIRKKSKSNVQNESTNSFQVIANEWFTKQKKVWVDSHIKDVKRRLEQNLYPKLGKLPVNQITSIQVLEAVRVIEKRGAIDLSHRVLGVCSQVFRYAVASGRCFSDPTRDLKGALTPHTMKHQNAIPPEQLSKLMSEINNYSSIGDLQTQLALELLAHTFVRTGELIQAKWTEFDFQKCIWKIPACRMKMKREHLVPLTSQVMFILERLKEFARDTEYVLAGRNPKTHISNNTLLFALYKLGYKGKMTGHGFRAVASTVLNENNHRADIIERQLAHLDGNAVRAAYNRAEYLKERTEMMVWWSNYLESITITT